MSVWTTQHPSSPPANSLSFELIFLRDSHEAEYPSSCYKLGQRDLNKGLVFDQIWDDEMHSFGNLQFATDQIFSCSVL